MGFFRKLGKINIRSIILNFRLFSFKQAIYLPLIVSRNIKITEIWRGGVQINTKTLFPGMIQLGYSDVGTINIKQFPSVLQISKRGKLVFNGKCHIGAGCNISVGVSGKLEFGESFNCSGRTAFIAHKNISFGNECLVSWGCTFMDSDFHKIKKDGYVLNETADIKINKNSWIGCNCNILKGSELPANSVLGAGSLLNKKYSEEKCIYAGVPAKQLVQGIEWEK